MPLSAESADGCVAPRNLKLLVVGSAAIAAVALTAYSWSGKSENNHNNQKDDEQVDGLTEEDPKFKPELAEDIAEEKVKEAIPNLEESNLETEADMSQEPVSVEVNTPINPIVPKTEHKSPSWSDLVEDDEREMAAMSEESKLSSQLSAIEISSPKTVPSNKGDFETADVRDRNHLDSGVASPNENHVMATASSSNKPEIKRRSESGETPDGGLGSSLCGEEPCGNDADFKKSKANHGGSDSGQGSEADDGVRMAFHFYIPTYLCGKLIGSGGVTIKQLKASSKCSIQLRELDENGCVKSFAQTRQRQADKSSDYDSVQVCMIEGTRSCIDHCLELIRQKFPVDAYQELTMEQINIPITSLDNLDPNSGAPINVGINSQDSQTLQPTQLGLMQGAMHEVYVSSIVSGGHIFLQQPNHPTHSALRRLENLMRNAYTKLPVPDVPRELIESGLMCVACCNHQWFRVQVVRYDSVSDTCDVKFVDYGGFYNLPVPDLRQIRSDFLSLPFQALECYLGNVVPPNGLGEWPAESAAVLAEMVANQIISGRMLGVNEDCVPVVHLYGWVNPASSNGSSDLSMHEQQPRLLNRELVDRGVAMWTEHITA